ncbi:MAG: hypothetical protein K0R24_1999 [Gammaproteobacteria bacterium]|nr:hypothetical protein [Gammaproteobacteria bacterium]
MEKINNNSLKKKEIMLNESKKEKIDLLKAKKRKLQTFRLRVGVIEALHEITDKINKKSVIKIPMGTVIELIILDASKKDVNEIIDLIKLRQ